MTQQNIEKELAKLAEQLAETIRARVEKTLGVPVSQKSLPELIGIYLLKASQLGTAALTAQALPEDGFQRGREYGLKEALNCVCEIHKDFAKSNAGWNAIGQALKAINKKRVKVKREKLAAIAAVAKDGAG